MTEQVGEDVRSLRKLLQNSEQGDFLANPFVAEDKKAILGQIIDNPPPQLYNAW